MDSKIRNMCNIKKMSKMFKKNIQHVKTAIVKKLQIVTLRIEIENQVNKKYFVNKIEIRFYKNELIDK